jgi:hypothetical protein
MLSDEIRRKVMDGNLERLTPDEQMVYYNSVCESLGLNPLTRPFAYIVLNKKLTLYCNKDGGDQLRRVNGVSITRVEKEILDGIFVVTMYAQDKHGRTDSDAGAVPMPRMDRYPPYAWRIRRVGCLAVILTHTVASTTRATVGLRGLVVGLRTRIIRLMVGTADMAWTSQRLLPLTSSIPEATTMRRISMMSQFDMFLDGATKVDVVAENRHGYSVLSISAITEPYRGEDPAARRETMFIENKSTYFFDSPESLDAFLAAIMDARHTLTKEVSCPE